MKKEESDEQIVKLEEKISIKTIEEMHKGIIAIIQSDEKQVLIKRQHFQDLLDRQPQPEVLKRHPFIKIKGKGILYLPISHIEGLLDALFFGQWETYNFHFERIGNELVGSIELSYTDPITDKIMRKSGGASEQIMVNALTDKEKTDMSKLEKSIYALDLDSNKKPAALSGLIGTLKTDCIKNAAKSIGNCFGRSINRDVVAIPFQILPTEYNEIKKVLDGEKK